MSSSGTKPTFSGYRVQVCLPALNRPSGLNVGLSTRRDPQYPTPSPVSLVAFRAGQDAGVTRTGDGLRRGIDRVKELKAEFLETGLHDSDTAFNLTWHDWLNLRSLIEISDGIAKSALWRENSRGAHSASRHGAPVPVFITTERLNFAPTRNGSPPINAGRQSNGQQTKI